MLDLDAHLPASAVVAALGALSNQTDSSEVRLAFVAVGGVSRLVPLLTGELEAEVAAAAAGAGAGAGVAAAAIAFQALDGIREGHVCEATRIDGGQLSPFRWQE